MIPRRCTRFSAENMHIRDEIIKSMTVYSSWCGQLGPDCREFTGRWGMKSRRDTTREWRSQWKKIWSYVVEAVMNPSDWKLIRWKHYPALTYCTLGRKVFSMSCHIFHHSIQLYFCPRDIHIISIAERRIHEG